MPPRLPVGSKLIANAARRGGNRLIDRAVKGLIPAETAGASLGTRIVGAALVRIATRSVPGAILVGGGLLARALHRKRKEARARKAIETLERRPR